MDDLIRKYIKKLESILGGDDHALEMHLTRSCLLGSSVKLTFVEDGFSELIHRRLSDGGRPG